MNRRTFTKLAAQGAAVLAASSPVSLLAKQLPYVRLGGFFTETFDDPEAWIAAHKREGYRAAYCPLRPGAADATINAYALAAKKADIIIAELWVGSNPISTDPGVSSDAVKKCVDYLALTDAIGANCCLNMAGTKNPPNVKGPHKDNFTKDTFDEIVEVTRKILNEVKPTRTYFTLEAMPHIYPDSADTYLDLIKAIDHKRFAVHLDPVNIIVSSRIYAHNGEMIKDFFHKLGPHIRSCHAKDIINDSTQFLPNLRECMPGKGNLDYAVYIRELSKLKDIPLMLEHLKTNEEYHTAAAYIRSVGKKEGIIL
jgi:sugar phosphate isomerase/epimerase